MATPSKRVTDFVVYSTCRLKGLREADDHATANISVPSRLWSRAGLTVQSFNASRPHLGQRLKSKSSLPQLSTKFGERAFSHARPAAWNSMPKHIRAELDIRVFRKLLKTHF